MKTSKSNTDPQTLMESVTLARKRLECAENECKEAKERAKQARHKRKEAKLLARRAKKQAKVADAARADAKEFLTDVEANLAKLKGSKAALKSTQPDALAAPKKKEAPDTKPLNTKIARQRPRKPARRSTAELRASQS